MAGILTAVFGAIGGFVSRVASFVGSTITAIGSTVCGAAKGFIGAVAKIGVETVGAIKEAVGFVGTIMHSIAEIVLGMKLEDTSEELGAKAVQAEKSIDDFDGDAEAYIHYLNDEIELDRARFEKMTSEEKIGCEAIGITLETKAVEQKLGGVEIPEESLAELGKIHMAGIDIDAVKLLDIIKQLKESGITNMNDIVDYLEGKGDSDRIKTGEALKSAMGDGALERIYQIRDAVIRNEEN